MKAFKKFDGNIQVSSSELHIFTPYKSDRSQVRVHLELNDLDYNRIQDAKRKGYGSYRIKVVDQLSKRVVVVRDADCGAGCRCAAEIVK